MAQEVAQGTLAKTGGGLAPVVARMRGKLWKGFSREAGRKAVGQDMLGYQAASQEVMSPRKVSYISLVADGTRFSPYDTLFSGIFSPELNLGVWCPPAAHAS
eukprot:4879195-Lingulodinium_polyedra.AAC.1